MDDRILKLLNGDPTHYPHALEQQFLRVLNKIVELWDTPAIERYFNELMVDNRGGTRKGFPREVASDIFALYEAYIRQHISTSADENIWSHVPEIKKIELEQLGFAYTPEGFAQAIESGNQDAVKIFLSCGIDVNARDERDWTPLMISSFNGNEELAALLIRCGAKIQSADNNGYTPLHWAAFNGYEHVVSLLLAKGALINSPSQFGWTALMQAATRGHAQVVSILLSNGALVNEATQDGWTALHKAAANGHTEIVLQLLEQGADRSIEYPDGSTALSLAQKNHHHEIVLVLSRYRSQGIS